MFGWLRPKAASAATIADDVQAANEPASSVDPDRLLRRLEWTVLRRLDGVLQGDYRTLFRGFGLDLADLREYQLNDDVRYIDWNVTARLQVPHVREFQEDREVAAWFVLDLSGSVDFGSQQLRKRALASELVAVLARLFTRYGNRVGAVLHSDRAGEVIPARSGRRHVLHILDRMVKLGEHSAAPSPTGIGRIAAWQASGRLSTRWVRLRSGLPVGAMRSSTWKRLVFDQSMRPPASSSRVCHGVLPPLTARLKRPRAAIASAALLSISAAASRAASSASATVRVSNVP